MERVAAPTRRRYGVLKSGRVAHVIAPRTRSGWPVTLCGWVGVCPIPERSLRFYDLCANCEGKAS